MSPEQQREAVHQRLSVAADEIFRILEVMMMGEYEAEVSGSHQGVGPHRQLLDITLKTETHLRRTGTLRIYRFSPEEIWLYVQTYLFIYSLSHSSSAGICEQVCSHECNYVILVNL